MLLQLNTLIYSTGTEELFSGAARIPLVTVPYGMGLNDMEFQIHCIETEAYGAVLRAFIAQSDVLSWVCSTDCFSLRHFFLLLNMKTLNFSLLQVCNLHMNMMCCQNDNIKQQGFFATILSWYRKIFCCVRHVSCLV